MRLRPILVALSICAVVVLTSGVPWRAPAPAGAAGGTSITAPDTTDDVGEWASLELDASGYPVISYYDVTNGNLKVMHCNDINCSGGDESITSPNTSGNVGLYTSLELDSSGYPVISYRDATNFDLKVMHCNDANCAGSDESITSPDTGGSVGRWTSLELDTSGHPVISYYDVTNSDLKVMHCNDANCAGGGESITSPDAASFVGEYTSLALDGSGYPVVSYHAEASDDLKLLHCNDANCAGDDESITSPDTSGYVGEYTSLALDASGYPVVSHYDRGNGDLRIVHCNDANCAGDDESITSPDSYGDVGEYTSLALDASGYPVVSYYYDGYDHLRVMHCNDPNCSGGDESITSPDTGYQTGWYTSLELDASGNPVVAYHDENNGDLKVLHCGHPNCIVTSNSVTNPGYTGEYSSLALDANGYPVVSYTVSGLADLDLMHCNDPKCSGGDESITVPYNAFAGTYTSLELDGSGYPVVSFFTTGLEILHCNDPNCSGGDDSITSHAQGSADGLYTSLQLDASGYPVVSYYQNAIGTQDLKVLHCNDPNCSGGGESITTPDTGGDVGMYSSLALDAAGYPVVAYWDDNNYDVKVMHCNDANCSGGDESITSPDTGLGFNGGHTSLALDASGYPVVSYFDNTNSDLRLLHCNDANCTGGDESITSPDTAGNVGQYTSLVVDASGYPVVSYYDTSNDDLKVMHCNDPNCSGSDESITSPDTAGNVGQFTSLALDAWGNPVVSYHDATGGDLKLLHCVDPECTGGKPWTLVVDSTSDAVDANPGDGTCATAGAQCTLRAAIQEANALTGPQSVNLPAKTYTLTIAGTGEDAAATGDLDITDDLTITGAAADTTIVDGGALDTVFHVLAGADVEVTGITVTGGSGTGYPGGIHNDGTLALSQVAISGNAASSNGGGINNDGTLTIESSTISGNTAGAHGGGIANRGPATLTMSNTTISGNAADGDGGGILQDNSGPVLDMNNVTIAFNTSDADVDATGEGGGLDIVSGTVSTSNTLLTLNTDHTGAGPDCRTTVKITSEGYNLLSNNTGCSFNALGTDQVGTGASPIISELGTLQDNGGPTMTHSLPADSPAIDTGHPWAPGFGGASCEATDQRGEPRPMDGDSVGTSRCDIGAFEAPGAITEPCPNQPDLPPPDSGCTEYDFTATLEVTATDISPDPLDCNVTGDIRETRDPVGDGDVDDLDDMDIEIVFLSGYIDCPGPLYLGSSIPSTGTVEEKSNVTPDELDFPANVEVDLCLTADTYPLGVLRNCAEGTPVEEKEPLHLTCTAYSMSSVDCVVVGTAGFFDGEGEEKATVEDGDFELVEITGGVGGITEMVRPDAEWLYSDDPSANSVGAVAGIVAAVFAAAALGGLASYARRRLRA
jgi:CSLREA domain-containing protein